MCSISDRPPNQITVDSITSTTIFISWAVANNESSTQDVPYSIVTMDEISTRNGYTILRPGGSGLRALGYNLTGLNPGYGYNIIVSSSELEKDISVFVRTGEHFFIDNITDIK